MATDHEEETNDLISGDSASFYNDMYQLIDNQEYSDVKFVFPDKTEIYGHKCILASRCEYFKELFDNHNNDDGHMIDDITPEHFRILLEFIYTNCCSRLNRENVFSILTAANKVGLVKMAEVCEDFLLKTLSITTACESMEAAVAFEFKKLQEELMLYFEGHTVDIFRQDSFKTLSPRTLAHILESSKLNIDEFDIYTIVREWSTVRSVALGIPVSDIAKEVANFIRLPLLTSEELSKIENENEDHLIPVEQISNAWKHLALKTQPGSSLDTTPRRGTKKRTPKN